MNLVQKYFEKQVSIISDEKHCAKPLSELIQSEIARVGFSHGEWGKWQAAVEKIHEIVGEADVEIQFQNEIRFKNSSWNGEVEEALKARFKELNPWRKGPFQIGDFKIDTEWQSWLKWDRLKDSIERHHLIQSKMVLDIGCSSGYYMYRMLEHSPKWIMGVDPTLAFYSQFLAFQQLKFTPEMLYLPMGSEVLNGVPRVFDTVFCMGILYHRKSPFEFLRELQSYLKPGGKLVMETLIVPGSGDWCLTPVDRYARMRNVFTVPTKDALIFWLEQFGFKDVDWVMDDWTELEEQRSTEWMTRESLKECLDPKDMRKTVEGYPAPRRCIVIATAK